MGEITGVPIVDFLNGGAAAGGHNVYLNVKLQDGSTLALLFPVEILERGASALQQLAGVARSERQRSDPTQRPGGQEYREARPVTQWEIATAPAEIAVILGARHPDGSTTTLALPATEVPALAASLQEAAAAIPTQGPAPPRVN